MAGIGLQQRVFQDSTEALSLIPLFPSSVLSAAVSLISLIFATGTVYPILTAISTLLSGSAFSVRSHLCDRWCK